MAPTQIIEFIGNLFDAINFTMGVTPCRLHTLMGELNEWRFKSSTTRQQLESLIGKLQFVSNCVRPGRLFRWFKFTLKPPNSIAIGKLRLAIWDTCFWTFWLKFGHKGP